MPAVVRGGRRQSSKAAPKKTAKTGSRSSAARAPVGKLHAMSGIGLSPQATGGAVLGLLLLGASLALFTGGRAQALGHAVTSAVDHRLAAFGFRVEKVHLEGVSPEAAPAVKAALGLSRGEPLARMDLAAIKARVEQVGWVKEAKVLRLLPDTLVISVTERSRLAVWQHQGHAVVIDQDGRPIPEADPANFTDLPLVVGSGADQAAAAILPMLRERPRLTARLEALVRVDDRRWDLRLKDGSLIQLPAIEEDSALIRLDQLDQRARLLELGFARIDLRDPEMVAVRPRNSVSTDPVAAGV
jgi:cell division protein FtsQ